MIGDVELLLSGRVPATRRVMLLVVSLAVLSNCAPTGASADAPAQPRMRDDAQVAEPAAAPTDDAWLLAFAEVYGAVQYFHPDVAPYPGARRAWNEASVVALERLWNGGEPRAIVATWLDSLGDPATVATSVTAAPAATTPNARSHRAWSHQGYPPDVRQFYGGGYRPFLASWRSVPGPRSWTHELPDGSVVRVRLSEAGDATEIVPDSVEARGTVVASEPYPSLGWRLLAGVISWNVMERFYPYRDLTGEDWDRVFIEGARRLAAATDAESYAMAAAWLGSRFHDSHAGISGETWDHVLGGAKPPVGIRIIDGRAVVTGVLVGGERRAQGLGLGAGDVVLAADGVSIGDRLDALRPLLGGSTVPAFRSTARNFLLGGGADDDTVRLTILDPKGDVRDVPVPLTSEGWWIAHRERAGTPVWRRLGDDVGYIDLTRLPRDDVDRVFAEFAGTRALVLDMRGYPQGTAWSIAPRLTTADSILVSRAGRMLSTTPDSTTLEWSDNWVAMEESPPAYEGRTVLLIDEEAVSQAEYSAMMFHAANGTLFVGSPSQGANGDVTDVALPGGLRLSFTGNGARHPDGAPLQRRGIVPDVYVRPTVDDIREGRDPVLEAALELLSADE